MSQPTLKVDDKPFFGRVEEQKQFRAALLELIYSRNNKGNHKETLPYVILLYGDGGIGKTTLSKRFRDIALNESPFENNFESLWVDWEWERNYSPALNVSSSNIRSEDIFDVIYNCAVRAGWQDHFKTYQKTVEIRKSAENQAKEILTKNAEDPKLATISGLGSSAIAKLARVVLSSSAPVMEPVIGDAVEKTAQIVLEPGFRIGMEQIGQLRTTIEHYLHTGLSSVQYDLFVNPNESLARALGEGIRNLAKKNFLLVTLDTYEIVDRTEPWLRMVISSAGTNVVWVISGRNDLYKSRRFGDRFFNGYVEDFPRRLLHYDVAQLALDDVKNFFAAVVPQRPLDNDEQAQSIRDVTHGIPLAIKLAAELWAQGTSLEDILGTDDEPAPSREIVKSMIERYLLHTFRDKEDDQYDLFALTLARGNGDILRAMLHPDDDTNFDLNNTLRRLERDYASVYKDEYSLHDEPRLYFEQHLRQDLLRKDHRIQTFNQRAVETLRKQLAQLEIGLPLIEDRCNDDDWINTARDLLDYLFWLDENQAWLWFAPCFVESLAYSRNLRDGLLHVVDTWQSYLSKNGKKRFNKLADGVGWMSDLETKQEMLNELEQMNRSGWLAGTGEPEHKCILAWKAAQLLTDNKKYQQALDMLLRAEQSLPNGGSALKENLAEAFDELATICCKNNDGRFVFKSSIALTGHQHSLALNPNQGEAWRLYGMQLSFFGDYQGALDCYQKHHELSEPSVFSWSCFGDEYDNLRQYTKAISAYQKAIECDKTFAYPWNGLGNVYNNLKRYDEAIKAYLKAIKLDKTFSHPWNGLGNIYDNLKRYDEAIAAYLKAIELDQTSSHPWNGLGNVYYSLDRYDEAIAAYQKMIELDQTSAHPWNGLGNVYYSLKHYDEAIAAYQKSIEFNPKYEYPWNGLADVYSDLKRLDEAIAAYQKSIELNPKYETPWNGLGYLWHDQERYDEAIMAYKKAIEINPTYEPAWNNLGYGYRDLKMYDDAIAAYQKAIEIDAKSLYPLRGLGILYSIRKEDEKALSLYQQAVDLDINNGTSHSLLAGALRRLKREDEALQELEIARPLIAKESDYAKARFEAMCGHVDEALRLLEKEGLYKPAVFKWAQIEPDFDHLREHPKFKELVGIDQ